MEGADKVSDNKFLAKLAGSRKAQIALGAVLLIILSCLSVTAGTVALCLLFSLGIWFGLHKLITHEGDLWLLADIA